MASQALEKIILNTNTNTKNFANTHIGDVVKMYSGPIGPASGEIGPISQNTTNNPLNPNYRATDYGLEPLQPNHNYLEINKNINIQQTQNNNINIPKIEPVTPLDSSPTIKPIGEYGSPSGVLHKPNYLEGGLERYRRPEWDPKNGNHMNYETLIPGIKKPIINIHLPMDD